MSTIQQFETKILKFIKDLNHKKFGDVFIPCNFNNVNYNLILMTSECKDIQDLMTLMAKWRKENEEWFPVQFNVTVEGTRKWFINGVIGAEDRLLFLVKDDDEYLGHVGLFRFNFKNRTCEIDNIVRGVSKHPGIMESAISYMMQWGRDNLGLLRYSLQTTSDNKPALKLYKKLGFVEIESCPLVCKRAYDRIEWVPAPSNYDKPIEKYNVVMVQENEA